MTSHERDILHTSKLLQIHVKQFLVNFQPQYITIPIYLLYVNSGAAFNVAVILFHCTILYMELVIT